MCCSCEYHLLTHANWQQAYHVWWVSGGKVYVLLLLLLLLWDTASVFHHYLDSCSTSYRLLTSLSNWSRCTGIKCFFFLNLGTAESVRCENNDLCLATNKNWPPHLFCIWGPIMCELKGKTPQEGVNRRQSGDRTRHGGQMAEREPLWLQRVFCCGGIGQRMGQPWILD